MKFLKRLWMITYVIVIPAVLLIFTLWIMGYFIKPYKVNDSWKYSKGVIYQIQGSRVNVRNYITDSFGVVVGYYDDYKGTGFCYPQLGEAFITLYNPNNIEEFLIQEWNPAFFKNEETKKTICKVIRISRSSVSFEYIIDGKKYEKCQVLPSNYKNKYPTLNKGQNYEVEYWVENPLRSIMHLDTNSNSN